MASQRCRSARRSFVRSNDQRSWLIWNPNRANSEPPGRDRHGFRALLICLLALVVLPAHFPAEDRHLFWVVVVTLCLLVCLYMAANNRGSNSFQGLWVAACAMIFELAGGRFCQIRYRWHCPYCFYVLFFLMVAAYLVRYLFKSDKISEEMIFASVCLYIILGLNWGFVYFLIEAFAFRILCQHTSH